MLLNNVSTKSLTLTPKPPKADVVIDIDIEHSKDSARVSSALAHPRFNPSVAKAIKHAWDAITRSPGPEFLAILSNV